MATSAEKTLWIVVVVLSVVCAAQAVYIIFQWRSLRRGGRSGGRLRPVTEEYSMIRPARPDAYARGTGYSPIEPPRTRWSSLAYRRN